MDPRKRLLDVIQIASPCSAEWDEMKGGDRVRFCEHCQLNVYNLSSMSADEAEAFLQSREGRVCLRLYQRPDGTVLTHDCPVGWRLARRKIAGMASALFAFACLLVLGLVYGRGRVGAAQSEVRSPMTSFREAVNPIQVMGAIVGPPGK